MKIKRITVVTATISVALAIAGCKQTVPSAAAAPPHSPSVPVAEVIVRPVTPYVEYTGSLAAVKRVELRPRVSGYIQDVNVPEGHFVEKGHRLFLIDPRSFQAALNAATARLREAEAASKLAQEEYARARQLFNQKVVARDRLDTAAASQKAGQAQVDAAHQWTCRPRGRHRGHNCRRYWLRGRSCCWHGAYNLWELGNLGAVRASLQLQ